MSNRYVIDSEGKPVEAILDLDELREVVEAQRQIAEAAASLEEATRRLAAAEAGVEAARYESFLRTLADSQRVISAYGKRLESLDEQEEELEAIRAYDADVAELEQGEDETVPLREALPTIERERDKLSRRGEL